MVGLLLSLSYAMCVRFTSEGGAKGNSDGQLVCNTLHGVVGQPGQRVQLLPGVGWRGNTFVWAADQHDVTAYIQRALDSTCWHRGGHWQMERVGDVVLTTLQSKSNVFLIAEEISYSKKLKKLINPTVLASCCVGLLIELFSISVWKDSSGYLQTEK